MPTKDSGSEKPAILVVTVVAISVRIINACGGAFGGGVLSWMGCGRGGVVSGGWVTGRRAFYIARRAYTISVSQVTVISLPAVSEHEERSQHACDRLVAAAKRSRVCNLTHPFALAMIVII